MKQKLSHLLIAAVCLAVFAGFCAFYSGSSIAGPKEKEPLLPINFIEGKIFRFMGGDAEDGKEAFAKLNCIQCHEVAGVDDLPKPKGKRRLNLILGKEVRFAKRYEDLIIAITNPRHVIKEQYRSILSKAELAGEVEPFMPDLSNSMSARQLIDLVTFLDAVYDENQASYLAGEKQK